MPLTPKSTAPVSFTVLDEMLSLIAGDPVWSWLEPWLPYVSNYSYGTADFCAQGGGAAPAPLEASEFFPPLSADPGEWLAWERRISARLTAVTRDRLFGAFCDTPVVVQPSGFCTAFEREIVGMSGGVGGEIVVPVPVGATQCRIHLVSRAVVAGVWGVQIYSRPAGGGGATLIQGYDMTTASPSGNSTSTVPSGGQLECNQSGNNGNESVFAFEFNANCPGAPYEPAAQPPPAGLTLPAANVYSDIADLGAELDRLERKLDWIIADRQFSNHFLPDVPGDPAEEIEVTDPDEVIDLVDAIGVVVTLGSVPADADVDFGAPAQYARTGRVNFGTATAWYPSVELTHSPMVIQPLPPLTTRMTVTVTPPVTATILPLLRPK